jgi:hypothetical protein
MVYNVLQCSVDAVQSAQGWQIGLLPAIYSVGMLWLDAGSRAQREMLWYNGNAVAAEYALLFDLRLGNAALCTLPAVATHVQWLGAPCAVMRFKQWVPTAGAGAAAATGGFF